MNRRLLHASIVCTLGVGSACASGSHEPYVESSPTIGGAAVTTSGTTHGMTSDDMTPEAITDGPFQLLFRDEFDRLDSSRWQLMTHSWEGNLAVFSDTTAFIEDGQLSLRVLPAPEGTRVDGEDKLFLAAEVRSKATLTYGRVRARIRFPRASAAVSSLVTMYTPWPADDWNEFDIESLGKAPNQIQFNAKVYDGPPPEPPVTESVYPAQYRYVETLGFDSSLEFHEYTTEWTPQEVTFWVDGEQRYSWSEDITRVTLPQNVLLTIWVSNREEWAGPVTEETAGATVAFDWVELWQYVDPTSAQGE